MPNIVVVGSLNMDVVAIAPHIPVPGETLIGSRYFTDSGGKGANQAYAAAKLGGRAEMLGRVGTDEFGREMRESLAHIGCGVEGILSVPGASGVALIMVAETGQNSIIVVPGANDAYSPSDVDADLAAVSGAEVVMLQLEIPLPSVLAAAKAAKKRGATVILDPAPAPLSPLSSELLGLIDILTPNETEASILAGLPPGRIDAAEAAGIAHKLQAMGSHTVIMKLGDQGCLVVERDRTTPIPAPKVTAVDTTAAGDVFNAGLAVGLSEGLSLVEACRFAVSASALSVTRIGAQAGTPSRAEVDAFAEATPVSV